MHIMIDIETMGITPGSIIASIGAFAFNTVNTHSAVFYKCVDIRDAQQHGLTFDAGTVVWWINQSEKAREAISSPYTSPLIKSLTDLSDFIKNFIDLEFKGNIWAKPTTFDIVLLEAAYRKIGLPIPWHYRDIRDVRTYCEAAGVWDEGFPFEGTEHNALDDAINQSKYVITAKRKLAGVI